MTSEEPAASIEAAVRAARHRILGIGAAQYGDGSGVQRFETLPAAELTEWLIEEADDLIAYTVLLRIRATRFADAARLLDKQPHVA